MVEEEIVEAEAESKQQKLQETSTSTSQSVVKKAAAAKTWSKSIGGLTKKGPLVGLVKVKKPQSSSAAVSATTTSQSSVAASSSKNEESRTVSNGLSLLGAYSDSDNSD